MEIHLLEYTEQHKMLSLGMLQNGVKNLEEIRKEPATMGIDPDQCSGLYCSRVYRDISGCLACTGIWSCLYAIYHTKWRGLSFVYFYVSSFWN